MDKMERCKLQCQRIQKMNHLMNETKQKQDDVNKNFEDIDNIIEDIKLHSTQEICMTCQTNNTTNVNNPIHLPTNNNIDENKNLNSFKIDIQINIPIQNVEKDFYNSSINNMEHEEISTSAEYNEHHSYNNMELYNRNNTIEANTNNNTTTMMTGVNIDLEEEEEEEETYEHDNSNIDETHIQTGMVLRPRPLPKRIFYPEPERSKKN